MPERKECNVCQSIQGHLIKKGVYGNPHQDIYKCADCEHVYIAPLLDDSQEAKFYLDQYSAFLHARGGRQKCHTSGTFCRQ